MDEQHRIEKIEFKLTSACQLCCLYCINNDGKETVLMDQNVVREIIAGLAPLKVTFTGGEPTLLFSDLKKLIVFAKSNRCTTQINTNAELLNSGKVQELADSGLDVLHVSFDSPDETTFNKLRGFDKVRPNVFARFAETLRNAAKVPSLTVIAETTVLSHNVFHLPDLFKLIADLGLAGLEVQSLIVGGRAQASFIPKQEDQVNSLLETYQLLSDKGPYLELWCCYFPRSLYPEVYANPKVRFVTCACGRTAVYLDMQGTVYACNFFSQKTAGNIYEPKERSPLENVLQIWDHHPFFAKVRGGEFGQMLCLSQPWAKSLTGGK